MVLDFFKLTGTGYVNGWWRNFKGRYRVFKGARNTKKSYDLLGLEIIDKIISDDRRNVLIIRNTFTSHRDSTWAKLVKLLTRPDPDNPKATFLNYFKLNKNEMRITYIPTGQVILFKGMDDAQKIQGIDVVHGYLTDVYVEEAFELKSYDEWYKVDGSIRGVLPKGLFFQITFLLNAWDSGHWINEKFFKGRLEDDYNYLLTHRFQDYRDDDYIGDFGVGLYLHISTYKINEFRDKQTYDLAMEEMRKNSIDLYKVIALGMWGNSTNGTYPEFKEHLILPISKVLSYNYAYYAIGIDFGISNGEGKVKTGKDASFKSATTMVLTGITNDFSKDVAIAEYFHSNEGEVVKTAPEIQKELIETIILWINKFSSHHELMKGTILVYVDCADSGGFRQSLELLARQRGLFNIKFIPSTKISIRSRVYFDRLQMTFGDCLVSDQCPNLIRELNNARGGEKGEVRADCDDHTINAWEYSKAPFLPRLKRWKNFKSQ